MVGTGHILSPEILRLQREGLLYPEEQYAFWPISEDLIMKSMDYRDNGDIVFRSKDQTAILRLFSNGFFFEVEYKYFFSRANNPKTFDLPLSTDDSNSVQIRKTHKSVSKGNSVNLRKIYNILDFPPEWSYPLLVVLMKYEERALKKDRCLNYRVNFSKEFLSFASSYFTHIAPSMSCHSVLNDQLFSTRSLPSDDRTEFLPEKYGVYEDHMFNHLPDPLAASDASITIDAKEIESKASLGVPEAIFHKDCVAFLNKSLGIAIAMNLETQLVYLIDGAKDRTTVYFTNQKCLHTEKELRIRRFRQDSTPKEIDKHVQSCIRECREFLAASAKEQYSFNFRPKKEPVPKKGQSKKILAVTSNSTGEFKVYKDGTVKILFRDQTIIKLNYERKYAVLKTNNGKKRTLNIENPEGFGYYVLHAINFYEDFFFQNTVLTQRLKAHYAKSDELIKGCDEKLLKSVSFLEMDSLEQGKMGDISKFFNKENVNLSNLSQSTLSTGTTAVFRENLSKKINE